ncbi:MAG: 30S ribosome-binding factor RbfA [Candidatus Omnitrophica bacterium]|nr:30S ribosome-binding factor RbfA [Candidatus Omnitrophota bacterium]
MIGRVERIGKLLRREISVILQTEIDDPRVNNITITRVDMTRDLSLAKVFYVLFGDKEREAAAGAALKSHAKFIRGELAHRVSMRYTPSLSFRKDRSEEYKNSIDTVFENIEKEHQADNTGLKGGQDEQ